MKIDNRKIAYIYGAIVLAACFVMSWVAANYPDAGYLNTIVLILVLLLCVVALLLMKRRNNAA